MKNNFIIMAFLALIIILLAVIARNDAVMSPGTDKGKILLPSANQNPSYSEEDFILKFGDKKDKARLRSLKKESQKANNNPDAARKNKEKLNAIKNDVENKLSNTYVENMNKSNAAFAKETENLLGPAAAAEIKKEQNKAIAETEKILNSPQPNKAPALAKVNKEYFGNAEKIIKKHADEKNIPQEKAKKLFDAYKPTEQDLAQTSLKQGAVRQRPSLANTAESKKAAQSAAAKTAKKRLSLAGRRPLKDTREKMNQASASIPKGADITETLSNIGNFIKESAQEQKDSTAFTPQRSESGRPVMPKTSGTSSGQGGADKALIYVPDDKLPSLENEIKNSLKEVRDEIKAKFGQETLKELDDFINAGIKDLLAKVNKPQTKASFDNVVADFQTKTQESLKHIILNGTEKVVGENIQNQFKQFKEDFPEQAQELASLESFTLEELAKAKETAQNSKPSVTIKPEAANKPKHLLTDDDFEVKTEQDIMFEQFYENTKEQTDKVNDIINKGNEQKALGKSKEQFAEEEKNMTPLLSEAFGAAAAKEYNQEMKKIQENYLRDLLSAKTPEQRETITNNFNVDKMNFTENFAVEEKRKQEVERVDVFLGSLKNKLPEQEIETLRASTITAINSAAGSARSQKLGTREESFNKNLTEIYNHLNNSLNIPAIKRTETLSSPQLRSI